MKILLITENWAPRIGGIENYLAALSQEIAKIGRVQVIAPVTEINFHDRVQDKVLVARYRFFNRWVRPRWFWLYRKLKKQVLKDKIDLVWCGKALCEGLIARRIKRKTGVGYMVCTYGMEIEQWMQRRRTRKQLQKVIKEAEKILYINDETKQILCKLGASKEQLIEVLPGVQERFSRVWPEEVMLGILRHYGVKSPFILSVGRLVQRKGFDVLIEAFTELDQVKFGDWQLVIVGNGPELDYLRELVRSNFAEKSVRFLTNVPNRHLPVLYRAAEFFAMTPKDLPGDKEGFGMVYTEASAAGRAVLATRTGGVVKAVVDRQTGILVAPNDIKAVKNGLENLIENKEEREVWGNKGQEMAQREWQWSKRAAELIKWIKERAI